MQRSKLLIALSLVGSINAASALAPSTGATAVLTPAKLSYNVAWGGTTLGDGSLILTAAAKVNCFHYELKTNPVGIVRWTYGSPSEASDFCVNNGVIQTSHHEFKNPKRTKDGFSLDFDPKKGQVTGGRNGPLPIKATTLDRLSIHQAARLWVKQHVNDAKPGKFAVEIADHKRIKAYTFAITGKGVVETPIGKFNAIRFERIDDPNTTLRFWLAPEKDYMPVKVEQIEDGETKLRMTLK